jgi:tRNA threonylcarbamoyladenosine biosynthesis protein TsaB
MAVILNLETATKNCSVSVAEDGVTLSIKEYAGEGYAHAEKLHVFIEEVLAGAAKSFNDIDAVAVSMGPGSYTGLRIGVSAAKGLCYALNIPLIAIDTLELIARQAAVKEGVVIPMIDARRMEVYNAVFSPDFIKVRETKAEVIMPDSFAEFNAPVHLCGDGAEKCREVLGDSGKFVYHSDIIYPSASQMGLLSFHKYKISDTVDVAYFEPYYLKDFIINK